MSNEKVRIFCLITQGEMGGAQQFVIQLARHLDQERFELHVVSGTTLAQQLPPHVSYSVAHHLVRPVDPVEDIRAIYEIRRMIRHYRPDVVLCISSKAGFVGSRAAHALRTQLPHMRVIYRIGGWTFNDPWPQWKKNLYIWLEKFSAQWKDTIVVNNTPDLEQARRLGITPHKELLRIYNGIDPYLDFLSRSDARSFLNARMPTKYRDVPHEYIIGTVANLYPAKDVSTLIRAASRVSGNVRFVVIGDGELRQQLEQQIEEHGLSNRFFLMGSISDAYKYVAAFDVFVLPSLKEGFPWAVLEAMAAKVPVVATRVGAIPEIITDHTSGIIVDPGAADQIAGGIVELLGNDRLRQDLAIHAHQRLISQFSLRSMIDQFERLFLQE